mmetsp:Transcript_45051/g.90927  ORF Transcript_45051/g.90927 Transcript_45051/m.90927 type:complete len:326 (-) Transcript_45051:13-990(-)
MRVYVGLRVQEGRLDDHFLGAEVQPAVVPQELHALLHGLHAAAYFEPSVEAVVAVGHGSEGVIRCVGAVRQGNSGAGMAVARVESPQVGAQVRALGGVGAARLRQLHPAQELLPLPDLPAAKALHAQHRHQRPLDPRQHLVDLGDRVEGQICHAAVPRSQDPRVRHRIPQQLRALEGQLRVAVVEDQEDEAYPERYRQGKRLATLLQAFLHRQILLELRERDVLLDTQATRARCCGSGRRYRCLKRRVHRWRRQPRRRRIRRRWWRRLPGRGGGHVQELVGWPRHCQHVLLLTGLCRILALQTSWQLCGLVPKGLRFRHGKREGL